jgi:hypothetical protein
MISLEQISVGSDTLLNKFLGVPDPLKFVFLHEFKTKLVKFKGVTQGSIWG